MELGKTDKMRKDQIIINKMLGITDEAARAKIEQAELILENITCLRSFVDYPALVELTVIRCKIEKIEGLDKLPNLTKLWLSENKITKLEGFTQSNSLEKLVLYGNVISKLENLEGLSRLKELDISQNKIEILENLEPLLSLEILNLAMNSIHSIGDRLRTLRTLQELNLSGNRINDVEEIKPLRELSNLRVLSFYDPHYGDNPICKNYNYQRLDRFDNLSINDDSRKSAVIEFKKKKIYYNMKIKSLQRLFTTVEKILRALKDKRRDVTLADIRTLTQFSGLEYTKYPDVVDSAMKDRELKNHEERKFTEIYEKVKTYIQLEVKKHINFITIELESTGNFKLEEGSSSERWFQSCINLVKSRFDAEDLQSRFGISGINVHRVLRIFNRILRNRFDERVEDFLDMSKPGYKKSFEYLFMSIPSTHAKQFYHLLERGYPSKSDCMEAGMIPYAPLFNTVFGADLPRIQETKQQDTTSPRSEVCLTFSIKSLVSGTGCLSLIAASILLVSSWFKS